MIYIDTSVVIAQLLAEKRVPDERVWIAPVASRLLEYELWTVVHRRGLAASHAGAVATLLARVAFVEMIPPVLARALEPFTRSLRTLDALHLSSALYLAERGQIEALATYDREMSLAGKAAGLQILTP